MQRSRKKQTRFAEESDDFSCDYKTNSKRRPKYARQEVFKCRHCHQFVGPLPSGGNQRNHCPFCLFSRHVDDHIGDRMSSCGASMEAIGYFQRSNGEYVIVHRCFACDLERFNRIAADDNFELVLSLPMLPPRTSREAKAQWIEEEIGNESIMHQIA